MYGICKSKHLAFRYHYHDALKIFVILAVHSLCFSSQKLFCSFIIGVLLQLVEIFQNHHSPGKRTPWRHRGDVFLFAPQSCWCVSNEAPSDVLMEHRQEVLVAQRNVAKNFQELITTNFHWCVSSMSQTSFKWNAQLGLGGTSPRHHSGTSPRCCAGAL